jgi:hypothetical protein
MDEYFIVIYEWIRLFFHVGLYPYLGTLTQSFVLAVIWGASGFMAATIAEMKGHSVMLHFAGGLLLPYAYPITIIFVLDEKFGENAVESGFDRSAARLDIASYEITEKIKQNRIDKKLDKLGVDADSEAGKEILAQEEQLFEKHHNTGTVDPEPLAVAAEETPVEPELSDGETAPVKMDKDYFDSIAVNQTGEREGPFDLELKNGNKVVAEIIVSTLDDVVVFEMTDHNGRTKRIRIKYENIASFDKRPV